MIPWKQDLRHALRDEYGITVRDHWLWMSFTLCGMTFRVWHWRGLWYLRGQAGEVSSGRIRVGCRTPDLGALARTVESGLCAQRALVART